MSANTIEAFLAYATIPIYVVGLLILVYIIAHSQTGLSITGEIKQSVKAELVQKRPKAPISSYIAVAVLLALLTFLAIIDQRGQHA